MAGVRQIFSREEEWNKQTQEKCEDMSHARLKDLQTSRHLSDCATPAWTILRTRLARMHLQKSSLGRKPTFRKWERDHLCAFSRWLLSYIWSFESNRSASEIASSNPRWTTSIYDHMLLLHWETCVLARPRINRIHEYALCHSRTKGTLAYSWIACAIHEWHIPATN